MKLGSMSTLSSRPMQCELASRKGIGGLTSPEFLTKKNAIGTR